MNVAYDNRSFMLDGRRIWIVAGEIHYFRHPNAEWREVLVRAKRAGLNTVCTYIPWNFHETTEGEADFEGDKDIGRYLDLIGELGMYAMVRPGPYICSEWDGGGIPAWLSAKPVLRFREDDPVYMAAVESWFGKLMPLFRDRLATRGGPIVTIQNENEYPGGWDASMRRYIGKLSGLIRAHGIDVPIVACNVHGDTDDTVKINDSTDAEDQIVDPSMILTYNHHVIVEPVKDLKSKQPNAPVFVTEFWCGAPIYWGNTVTDWPEGLGLARAAYEYASYGAQVCYYMFDGGTNFGFWGGNNIATSYASGYPVGEGGMLTAKYYAIRPVNLFALSFGDFLAASSEREDRSGFGTDEGVRLVVRDGAGGEGAMAFVSVRDGRKDVSLTLPGGRRLTVSFGEVAASVIPVGLKVGGATIDYSNLCLLARGPSDDALILYGPAGAEGVVSVNGVEARIAVGRRKVACAETGGVRVYVADEEMARRCWIEGERVVFGPDYAGEQDAEGKLDVRIGNAAPDVVEIARDGAMNVTAFRHRRAEDRPPALEAWSMAACAEPEGETDRAAWTKLDEPLSHEKLGVVQGYVWYAAEFESPDEGDRKLLLSHASNRISVFANGSYAGAHANGRSVRMRDEYGHPADWAFEELNVRVKRGNNRFVFLSDDSGHNYDVPMPTGIQGPVYAGSRRVEIGQCRENDPAPVSEDAFRFLYSRNYREPAPLPSIEFSLDVGPGEDAILSVHGAHAWVTVNGEEVPPLSYPESPWTMFSQIKRWLAWKLPASSAGRSNEVRIQYAECSARELQENLAVYLAPRAGELTEWRWREWTGEGDFRDSQGVEGGEKEKESPVVLLPVGGRLARKGRRLSPAYFKTSFPLPEGDRPVYLDIGELQKGQLYLNGRNVGRFWAHGGTQRLYYLPRSWMKENNELVVFEELGLFPQSVSLAFGQSGDWTKARL